MPCQFCNFDCFVSIPKDTPAEIAAQIRDQNFFYSTDGMLATCPDGQKEDKASLWGANYSEIMAAICAKEKRTMIDSLLDRQSRSQEAILHLFNCQFDESIEFKCSGCVAAHELLDEMKNG